MKHVWRTVALATASLCSAPALAQTQGVTVGESTLSLNEGGAGTYTLVLNTAPSATTTVTATSDNPSVTVDSDATPQTQELTFTTGDWNSAQTVTVTATQDGDSGDESVTISHTVTGYGSVATAAGVAVAVTDDDAPSLSLVSVALGTDPPSPDRRSGTIFVPWVNGADNEMRSATGASYLQATTAPQVVRFEGIGSNQEDRHVFCREKNVGDNSFRLFGLPGVSFTQPRGGCRRVGESRSSLTVELSQEEIDFGGVVWHATQSRSYSSGSYSISARWVPIVTAADVALSPPFNTAQTSYSGLIAGNDLDYLRITPVFDPDTVAVSVNNATSTTVASGMDYAARNLNTADSAINTVAVAVAGVGGATSTYMLRLEYRPKAAIAATNPSPLTAGALDGATVTVELSHTTFAAGVAASHFALGGPPGLSVSSAAATGAISTVLTLGYSGSFDTVRTLAVTVADSAHTASGALTTETVDIAPTPSVTVSRASLTLTEGGGSGTYTVSLGGQPTGTATVRVTSTDANVATVDTDAATGLQDTLTFTPTTWNTARTVTVAPQDDDDAVDGMATINHAVANYGGAIASSVSVTVEDDETAAIVIDADPSTATVVDSGPLALAEGATSSTPYAVRLSAQPTGTVTVRVSSADPDAATVDTSAATGLQDTLSFTIGNWDTAQTAWLTPVDDTDPNSEEVAIDHAASGGGYNGVSARLVAEVADDDVGVIVDTDPNTPGDQLTAVSLREGGTRTYRVRLSTLPAGGNVTVSATSSNAAITVSPGSLTFTAQNWATARTVTVRAEHDDDAVGEWTMIVNEANGGQYNGEATGFRATAEDDEAGGANYDSDGDFLIEIDSLAKLNAVRWDLDGNGAPASGNAADYEAAFAGAAAGMGCLDGPDTGDDGDCVGYELTADLDFDTDNDGDVDADDDYPNWAPIGGVYAATFHGNGRVIANLRHSSVATRAGLFWAFGSSAKVRGLGLLSPSVTAAGTSDYVGALAGYSEGVVAACYVLGGDVTSTGGTASVGGLLGGTDTSGSVVRASYATAAVNNSNQSNGDVGGLVGLHNKGTIESSYAAGAVAGGGANTNVGGLVGTGGAGATIRELAFGAGRAVAAGGAGAGCRRRRPDGEPVGAGGGAGAGRCCAGAAVSAGVGGRACRRCAGVEPGRGGGRGFGGGGGRRRGSRRAGFAGAGGVRGGGVRLARVGGGRRAAGPGRGRADAGFVAVGAARAVRSAGPRPGGGRRGLRDRAFGGGAAFGRRGAGVGVQSGFEPGAAEPAAAGERRRGGRDGGH